MPVKPIDERSANGSRALALSVDEFVEAVAPAIVREDGTEPGLRGRGFHGGK